MASSPKKGRPASVTLVRTPAPAPAVKSPAPAIKPPAPVVEPPAPEVSALALEAAEPAPFVEIPAAPPVVEAVAAPVAMTPAAVEVEAPKSAEAKPVEVPAPVAAFNDNMRSLVEKSLAETRARFDDVKAAAQEATAAIEASYGAAHEGAVAFNAKAIDALTAGAHAQFDHIVSLASAKSFSEVLTLQGEFARKRFEEATSQAKEIAELARKVADETVAPIKAQVAKTLKVAV